MTRKSTFIQVLANEIGVKVFLQKMAVISLLLSWMLGGCAPKFAAFDEKDELNSTLENWDWLEPVSRENEEKWNERRQIIRSEIVTNPKARVLFLGDSIMQGWRRHTDLVEGCLGWIWDENKPFLINAGIWSDGLQHMRWRLRSGDLAGLSPDVIVFLGGTNNGGQSAFQIAGGIQRIVEEMVQKFPKAHVIILGIFPMEEYPGRKRLKRRQVNAILSRIRWNLDRATFLDISDAFLSGTTQLSRELFPDFLHLSRLGYSVWMSSMCPLLREHLK